jgi:hypothetical protein
MALDGLDPLDLTGRWVGFYRHIYESFGAFPITAELRHEGRRLAGEMYDQVTDRTELLHAMVESYGERIAEHQRRKIEALIDHFGDRNVEFRSHLPESSDLAGSVRGDRVAFVKSYRGDYEIRVLVEGRENRTVTFPDHKVHYSGRLDRERGTIEGEWIIRWPGPLGRLLPPRNRGTFSLYRKS